ncbi:MAG: hypothetical protein MUP21_00115 [Dehalococcoidia bacterium]|nr:hypothetical protein [Dehalococcoidia bacterium]
MLGKFWEGFFKKAEEADIRKLEAQGNAPMLARTISKAGPRADDITAESDRAKFETFKG